MQVPVIVPELQTAAEPLCISGWLIEVGDSVIGGELVAEVGIPGVTFDLLVTISGELVEIVKPIGAPVFVGDTIGWIEASPD